MKIPNHNWHIEEFVDPETLKAIGQERAIMEIDSTVVITVDAIKTNLGDTVTINDYFWGGNYKYSGLRPITYREGALFSSHRRWKAFDLKFAKWPTEEVLARLIKNSAAYPFITRIEDVEYTRTSHGELGRDWLHIEIGNRVSDKIEVFKP